MSGYNDYIVDPENKQYSWKQPFTVTFKSEVTKRYKNPQVLLHDQSKKPYYDISKGPSVQWTKTIPKSSML